MSDFIPDYTRLAVIYRPRPDVPWQTINWYDEGQMAIAQSQFRLSQSNRGEIKLVRVAVLEVLNG